jgi:hydrogenase nickel incorporation protein HypA/HybF
VHEYSIVASLVEKVEQIAREKNAAGVHRVRVKIGELAGVETELLATAYDTFRAETVCANANLEIVSVPARWACRRCGRAIRAGEILTCPDCGAPARLAEGDEILLEQVELEVA